MGEERAGSVKKLDRARLSVKWRRAKKRSKYETARVWEENGVFSRPSSFFPSSALTESQTQVTRSAWDRG